MTLIRKELLPNPLPEPLRGAEIGSFAHHTITVRLPAIGLRVLQENEFALPVQEKVQRLVAELPSGKVRLLDDSAAPDRAAWNHYLQPYLGMDWLQIPWFLAETYFYRRLLEATGYFQPGVNFMRDPYAWQKQQGLVKFDEQIRLACSRLQMDLDNVSQPLETRLARRLLANLWGNQVDLSMWPAGQANRPDHPEEAQRRHLLSDHTLAVSHDLLNRQSHARRVDLILDNAGLELVQDLLLCDFLLETDLVQVICLHAKPHPTFVSDAMPSDIHQTLAYLAASEDSLVNRVGLRLQERLAAGLLKVHDHFYWTSPLPGWELPDDLIRDFRASALLISKGDANYRRFLGDRHWAFDTPLETALGYLPFAWLGLRVSKSPVMVALKPGKAEELDAQEAGWLTNGRWGVIQFYRP